MPHPEGPMTATISPRGNTQVYTPQGMNRRTTSRVGLLKVPGLDHGVVHRPREHFLFSFSE